MVWRAKRDAKGEWSAVMEVIMRRCFLSGSSWCIIHACVEKGKGKEAGHGGGASQQGHGGGARRRGFGAGARRQKHRGKVTETLTKAGAWRMGHQERDMRQGHRSAHY